MARTIAFVRQDSAMERRSDLAWHRMTWEKSLTELTAMHDRNKAVTKLFNCSAFQIAMSARIVFLTLGLVSKLWDATKFSLTRRLIISDF